MPDLLVKLYELPDERPFVERLQSKNICIRKGRAWEKHQVCSWVEETFGKSWASECDVAFSRQPIACYLATNDRKIIGFACYDSSMKNFFGPMGVLEQFRGKNIGTTLLLKCLGTMAEGGYAYAIVGDSNSPEFYEKAVKAQVIFDSSPGVYFNRLKS